MEDRPTLPNSEYANILSAYWRQICATSDIKTDAGVFAILMVMSFIKVAAASLAAYGDESGVVLSHSEPYIPEGIYRRLEPLLVELTQSLVAMPTSYDKDLVAQAKSAIVEIDESSSFVTLDKLSEEEQKAYMEELGITEEELANYQVLKRGGGDD